jgi:cbb3-type cytochrome oxidase maturation protein
MGILIFLILVSLFVALFFLGVFIWSVKKGQFDDDFTPALRILNDDEKPNSVKQTNSINQ